MVRKKSLNFAKSGKKGTFANLKVMEIDLFMGKKVEYLFYQTAGSPVKFYGLESFVRLHVQN